MNIFIEIVKNKATLENSFLRQVAQTKKASWECGILFFPSYIFLDWNIQDLLFFLILETMKKGPF